MTQRPILPLTDVIIQDIKELWPDADVSIIAGIYFFDGWSDWEESGGYLIFQGIDESIQCIEYGDSVWESGFDIFEPRDITEEQMEAYIAEIEKIKG